MTTLFGPSLYDDWKSAMSKESSGYLAPSELEARELIHRSFAVAGISLHEWAARNLAKRVSNCEIIMDIGAGLGSIWKHLQPQLSNRHKLILCDRSPAMVELLRDTVRGRFSCLVCRLDMEQLPLNIAHADLLLVHSVLHFASNPYNFLERISHCTSGSVSFVISGAGNMSELIDFFEEGMYGFSLKDRPLSRFNEVQADPAMKKYFPRHRKLIYRGELHVDAALPLVEYIASFQELRDAPDREYILRDFHERIRWYLSKETYLRVNKRYCQYVTGIGFDDI